MKKGHKSTSKTLSELLTKALKIPQKEDVIHGVGESPLQIIQTNPEAVIKLAHQKLHAFPYKDVPTCWRRLYEEASLWKVVRLCEELDFHDKAESESHHTKNDWITEAIATIDMALILTGAPGRSDLISSALKLLAQALDNEPSSISPSRPHKRQRLISHQFPIPTNFANGARDKTPTLQKPVKTLRAPSLETFQTHVQTSNTPLLLTNTITHWPALTRWPNPQYWLKCTHGGRRLVPVEVGRSYTDEGWSQRIVPFGEFLRGAMLTSPDVNTKNHTLEHSQSADAKNKEPKKEGSSSALATAYLAQHDLLTQIPHLRSDVAIPDYCYATTSRNAPSSPPTPTPSSPSDPTETTTEPSLNIWLGPGGTISPAHTDPHQNLLAQVFGRKYVRLFRPEDGEGMYPIGSSSSDEDGEKSGGLGGGGGGGGGVDMHNTSRVDVGLEVEILGDDDFPCGGGGGCDGGFSSYLEHDDDDDDVRVVEEEKGKKSTQRRNFPFFHKLEYLETVLGPGEVLYIPRGWWHYVRALEASCSVSFWWD